MPLLSLPHEILLNIIDFIILDDHWGPMSAAGGSGISGQDSDTPSDDDDDYDDYDNDDDDDDDFTYCTPPPQTRICTPRNITNLAHTCQLLRSLSRKPMYSTLAAYTKYVPTLHHLVTSDPFLAACVRNVSLYMPDTLEDYGLTDSAPYVRFNAAGCQPLGQILGSCAGLKALCINASTESRMVGWEESFGAQLLEYLEPSSKRALEVLALGGLAWNTIMAYFQRLSEGRHDWEFSALQAIRIEGVHYGTCDLYDLSNGPSMQPALSTQDENMALAANWVGEKLESVEMLTFKTVAQIPHRADIIGVYLARLMPNVEVLRLNTGVMCMWALLWAYSNLGSHLTDISLVFHSLQNMCCCDILAKLSPILEKCFIMGGTICHKLFEEEAKWPSIIHFYVVCNSACKAINHDLLRGGLEKLTKAQPEAAIHIGQPFRPALISWNWESEGDRIAPLSRFKGFEWHDDSSSPRSLDWPSD